MSFSEKPQISLFTNGFAEEYPPYQQQPPSPSSASMQPQTPTTPTRQHRPSLSSTTLFGRSNSLATDPTPGTPNSQTLFRQTPQDYPWYEGEATSPTTNTNGHRNSMARASSGSLRSSTGSAMGSNGIVASLISAYEGSTKRQEKQKQIDELDAELRAVTKEREQVCCVSDVYECDFGFVHETNPQLRYSLIDSAGLFQTPDLGRRADFASPS